MFHWLWSYGNTGDSRKASSWLYCPERSHACRLFEDGERLVWGDTSELAVVSILRFRYCCYRDHDLYLLQEVDGISSIEGAVE
nr:putative integron gene cassette protein [uncultured bacterium]